MKASQLFYPTLREIPSEAEIISHQLLLRAGFVRKTTAGVYTYLPLAQRVLKKISDIVREEMNKAGGQEVMMPIIQPRELWEKSGRWSLYGEEMFKLSDRRQRDFALGPTHEELITTLVNMDVHSYKGLPLMLYQIQNKYRDEIRPRFGLMRGREFIMKDLYSFDVDLAGLDESYKKMHHAYQRIYERLGLDYRIVEADSGAIGGNESHEFMVLAETGESEIVYCPLCDYAANVEKAVCLADGNLGDKKDMKPLTEVHTPGQRTISDIAGYLNIPEQEQIKTLMYMNDDELVAAIIRGDRELNEIKLKNAAGGSQIFMADEATVKHICGAGFGSLGPVGMKVKIYIDNEAAQMKNFACGANQDDYHYTNVNIGRDFAPFAAVDIRNAVKGDKCPSCSGSLQIIRGIEVGHIFKLGTRYSKALEAAFLDSAGVEKPFVMGCYGIGISRTMAAAVEQNNDEYGIIWPLPIAPFQVIIVPVNIKNQEQQELAESIYNDLTARGIEVLLDDRDERAGVKFKDADLIGIPLRITIGPKSLQENKIEMKKRWENESVLIDIGGITPAILDIIGE